MDTNATAAAAIAAVIAINTGAMTTAAAVTVATAVTTAIADSDDFTLQLLASTVPTAQRGQLVHRLYTDLDKIVYPASIETAVKAAATAALAA